MLILLRIKETVVCLVELITIQSKACTNKKRPILFTPMTKINSTAVFLAEMVAKFEVVKSENVESHYTCTLDLLKILGCQYVVYTHRQPVPLSRQSFKTIHNLPANLTELCTKSEFNANDNLIEFWDMHNIYWGWTVRFKEGTRWGASLAGISDRPFSFDGSRRALIICLALFCHLNLKSAIERSVHTLYKLSRKEIEVLRWTADGKTSAEIARVLSVSENTINFHQKNVKEKLSCSTKTSCTVYAAMLGLL